MECLICNSLLKITLKKGRDSISDFKIYNSMITENCTPLHKLGIIMELEDHSIK